MLHSHEKILKQYAERIIKDVENKFIFHPLQNSRKTEQLLSFNESYVKTHV